MKYAGHNGNKHFAVRVTPFFDSAAEVWAHARLSALTNVDFVAPCANWQEHMRWNKERVGNYANCPVQE